MPVPSPCRERTIVDYPIANADQLRHYVRSLRKSRGLTQAALAQRMGVSQARIAEIEARPHLISVEQFLGILSILHARLVIQDMEPLPVQEKTVLGISLRKGEW